MHWNFEAFVCIVTTNVLSLASGKPILSFRVSFSDVECIVGFESFLHKLSCNELASAVVSEANRCPSFYRFLC